MIDFWDIFLLVLMLVLSAIFSGIEIAFVSTSRLKIELKSAQGDRVGQRLSSFVKNTPRVITTILVGNNLALVLYGMFIAKVLAVILGMDANELSLADLTLQTLISTLVILFLGEYIPKAIFRLKAEQIMFNPVVTRFLQFFYVLFGPFVTLVNRLSSFFLIKIMRLKYEEEELAFGKEDLNLYMRETVAATNDDSGGPDIDAEMFENAMDFNDTKVREFMVPRTELHALPVETEIDILIDTFVETGHSKIIIYKENLDQILGFVHSSSLFKRPPKISDALQPLLTVPETMPANVLFSEFTKNRRTIALVVDEFGGTAGLATVEDLVEEVFGEIMDEHDDEEEDQLLSKQINESTWLLSARHEVDDLNEDFQLKLPEGEYTTLAGLIFHYAESIPKISDELFLENYKLIIVDATRNKVNTVRLEKLP